jgi:hypothetical protein
MKEAEVSKSVLVVSTSTSPTTLSDWSRYKSDLLHTPTPLEATGLASVKEGHDIGSAEGQVDDRENVGIANRAYPHLVEAAQSAVSLMRHSLDNARLALTSYDDADIDGVASRLSAIAAQCAKAHQSTAFNEAFGAVVSYVRRATLAANAADIARAALNSLVQALNQLTNNPMISLAAAADMLTTLSDDGWEGEHRAVNRLLALFTEDSSSVSPVATGLRM